MMTRAVRRNTAPLGEFSDAEIVRLLAKGRLQATDEVRADAGQWISVGSYAQSIVPVTMPSSDSQLRDGFFVHYHGARNGPFNKLKLESMVRSGLLDASAMVEAADGSSAPVPIGSLIGLPVPPPFSHSVAQAPVVSSPNPAGKLPDSSSDSGDGAGTRSGQSSYLELWIQCAFWIFVAMCVLGYLNNRGRGLAAMMGAGLLLAPIKGAILAWIIWAVRRK